MVIKAWYILTKIKINHAIWEAQISEEFFKKNDSPALLD